MKINWKDIVIGILIWYFTFFVFIMTSSYPVSKLNTIDAVSFAFVTSTFLAISYYIFKNPIFGYLEIALASVLIPFFSLQIFLWLGGSFSIAHIAEWDKFLFPSIIMLVILVPFAFFGVLAKLLISFTKSHFNKPNNILEKPKESKK